MANRARVVGVIIMHEQDGLPKTENVLFSKLSGGTNLGAVFWHEACIESVLTKYYDQNSVPLTSHLHEELRARELDANIGDRITPEHIRTLWNKPADGRHIYMMAKDINCPVMVY